MRVSSQHARAFYEIEATQPNWTARETERQIQSLLFERLAKSRDKKEVMALATKGQVVQTPADVFKDPMVIEFLGLPESHRLVETKLEEALISNLQEFLWHPIPLLGHPAAAGIHCEEVHDRSPSSKRRRKFESPLPLLCFIIPP